MKTMIDKELIKSYISTDMSTKDIILKTGFSPSTIFKVINEAGVDINDRNRSIKSASDLKRMQAIPKSEIQFHVDDGKTMTQIRKYYKCSMDIMKSICTFHNIVIVSKVGKKRNYKYSNIVTKEIMQKYTDEPTSLMAIGEILNMEITSVKRYMKIYNIDRTECNKQVRINSRKNRLVTNSNNGQVILEKCKTCVYRKKLGIVGTICDYAAVSGLLSRGCTPSECTHHTDEPKKRTNSPIVVNSEPLGINVMSQT